MTARSDACTVTTSRADRPGGAAGAGNTVRRISFIELAPLPSAVPCARLHAVHVLRDWDLRDLAGDTALIVSELVTNAVTASASLPARPPVSLQLISDGPCLRIEVQDRSPLDLRPGASAPSTTARPSGPSCGSRLDADRDRRAAAAAEARAGYRRAGKPSTTLKPKTESSLLKQAGRRKDRP